MTIGIKLPADETTESEFFIYFDAVTAYSRGRRGQVTKNPTARGMTVTDNFTSDNPSFAFTGVITFADISSIYPIIRDEEDNVANNAGGPTAEVLIESGKTGLLNYLPDSIGQFLPKATSSVTVGTARTNYKDYVESQLELLMSGQVYNIKSKRQETRIRPIKLYEYTESELSKIYSNVCLVGYEIKETPDSGNALTCDLQFEKVTFVQLKLTSLSPDVVKALKPKAATKAKKGNVDSTVNKADSEAVPGATTGQEDLEIQAVKDAGGK